MITWFWISYLAVKLNVEGAWFFPETVEDRIQMFNGVEAANYD